MANYGANIYNSKGYKIAGIGVDIPFTLRSSGQITDANFTNFDSGVVNPGGDVRGTISVARPATEGFNSPIIFFRPINSTSRVGVTSLGGIQDRSHKDHWLIFKWSNLSITGLQYYIFDRWNNPTTGDYGMRIRDEKNTVTFDSNWPLMDLRDVIWMETGFPNWGTISGESNVTNISTKATGDLALSIPNPRTYASTSYVYYTETGWVNGSNVQVSVVPFRISSGGVGNQNNTYLRSSRTQVMIANVAHLPKTYNPISFRAISSYDSAQIGG
ncbi:hypothetical protein [Rosenbergiella epipactidis]|uniref:hypothetical protein n=1 Tax=Rosenbergiella epipactidis TaxID=1544694 RepID=UPI001F4DABD3|nr:hypothetical protein [Rosenbergiella epipactidis]